MRFTNVFTGDETDAFFYTGTVTSLAEVQHELQMEMVGAGADGSVAFQTRFGALFVRANRWLYVDPANDGIWILKQKNFEQIWVRTDAPPRLITHRYKSRNNGHVRNAVQFTGENALVLVHMLRNVKNISRNDKDDLVIESKNGMHTTIRRGWWLTTAVDGSVGYSINNEVFSREYEIW
jgi:hypothetical protein